MQKSIRLRTAALQIENENRFLRSKDVIKEPIGTNASPPSIFFSMHFLHVAAKRIEFDLNKHFFHPFRVFARNTMKRLANGRVNLDLPVHVLTERAILFYQHENPGAPLPAYGEELYLE